MKVAIIYYENKRTNEVVSELTGLLNKANITIDKSEPDIVISVGGDGTLLSTFHQYYRQLDTVRFIGIHTGHLGFYTDWREYELEELVESLLKDTGESVSYPLLDIEIMDADQQKTSYLALNEGTIKRMNETLVCDVYIKDEPFERFRGDGLCVSTPTGSTGYNKSLGGAVLHPRLEAMQLTEIASLNNRIYRTLSSPMVVAPDEWITLKPTDGTDIVIGIDQLSLSSTKVSYIRFRIAKERIHFARYRHTHFWTRVEDAFIGGEDLPEL